MCHSLLQVLITCTSRDLGIDIMLRHARPLSLSDTTWWNVGKYYTSGWFIQVYTTSTVFQSS